MQSSADSALNVNSESTTASQVRKLVRELIIPERRFIRVAIAYGLAISLLTLAVPVAVQALINSVVHTASINAVVWLAVLLFVTLLLSGLFSLLRTYIMEKYQRHIYARLTAEISIRTIMAHHDYFSGRRNADIPNRYFDIGTFQKNLPPLLVDGFALCLQMIVGFVVVSFYHPLFLAFSLIIVAILYLIWSFWVSKAVVAAVGLSHAKYAMAKWLGDLAAANSFFKSSRHIEFAREKTDQTTSAYIKKHKTYFRFTFAQIISLIVLYALASSTLLGLGGVLVIRGELSVGQLVAAELILAAIFFGLSQAGTYLKLYYELCGAADELGLIFQIPMEEHDQGAIAKAEHAELSFHHVEIDVDGNKAVLDFQLQAGEKNFVTTQHAWLQSQVTHMLKQNIRPTGGWVKLGEYDLRDYNIQNLRQTIQVIDRSPIVECTIVDFLRMSAPETTLSSIQQTLLLLGLDQKIAQLPDGMETSLSTFGAPLLTSEFILLKLAAALLAHPQVVVLTQYFDNMATAELQHALNLLSRQSFTVLYFTNHPLSGCFDKVLNLDTSITELSIEAHTPASPTLHQ